MAAPPVTPNLELFDIQGLVVRGYGDLKQAQFLVLEVHRERVAAARAYLHALARRLNTARDGKPEWALQVALSAPGMHALGVDAAVIDTFSREFKEGMGEPIRAESLGDEYDNAPKEWKWGNDGKAHVLLLAYAKTKDALEDLLKDERDAMNGAFVETEHTVKSTVMLEPKEDHFKEHFGWRDGISMPKFAGVTGDGGSRDKDAQWWTDPIAPGEFVLGYPNEYKVYGESPTMPIAAPAAAKLATTPDGTKRDLGKNGTYLVFREMEQDVFAFWRYLAASREPGATPVDKAVALGSKMVGRWPGGAPLMTSPTHDDAAKWNDNKFKYRAGTETSEADPIGLTCPIGSHIRRASPRDHRAEDRDAEESEEMVRKHQMVRRGRPFGVPVSETMEPEDLFAKREANDGVRRGLHFLCLVGNIARQFEFVQRAWIDSPVFGANWHDGDPIIAQRRRDVQKNDQFTCPATPVRRRYDKLPDMTKLVGGGYFFLPGITALEALCG